jgi:3-dehydroquinate synthase
MNLQATLHVELGDRSYPIYIGSGLLGRASFVAPHLRGKQVMIVTNATVAPLYLDKTSAMFAGYHCEWVVLPDGEEYKNLAVLDQIFDALLSRRFDRQCTLVALGGGVIGDMAGFAAASYQRGVDFIQIPTTLLAQVDSSVGGKTGVNHVLGKNMIGAFHQPRCVVIDTETLDTLDARQLSAGLAEVVKYGLINDAEFFVWLEQHHSALREREPTALAYAIQTSCRDKAAIVGQDERESGQRALLNLGHTFGHAIETGTGYTAYLHGEGVSIGMKMAAELSARLGWMPAAEVARVEKLLRNCGLPVDLPAELTPQRMLELMQVDKKVRDGKIRLVLMQGIGKAIITEQYDPARLWETLERRPLADGG